MTQKEVADLLGISVLHIQTGEKNHEETEKGDCPFRVDDWRAE